MFLHKKDCKIKSILPIVYSKTNGLKNRMQTTRTWFRRNYLVAPITKKAVQEIRKILRQDTSKLFEKTY